MLFSRATTFALLTTARDFSFATPSMASIKTVTVVGSGLMGMGIAQVAAQANLNVSLVDTSDSILTKSGEQIKKSVERIAKKKFSNDSKAQAAFLEDVVGKIKTTTDMMNAVEKSDLVIEAVVENLQLKQKLFSEIETAASSSTLLATNTSSLRLRDISKNLKRKENFGGLHFFNPVPVMKLLEVVRTPNTSDETFETFLEFSKTVGKTAVKCKDTPGFIVNRLLVPYMFEALRMVERGDASILDIDTAMKLGAGYPMGPFELIDYVGLDTTKFIQDGWHESYPDEPLFKPCEIIDKLVKDGKLGRKSGEGFFKY